MAWKAFTLPYTALFNLFGFVGVIVLRRSVKSKYPSKNGRKDQVLEFYDYMVKSKANMLIYYIAKINTTIVK